MKSIVVATDGSPGSQLAVAQAIALASGLGAKVTFVSVLGDLDRSRNPVSGEQVDPRTGPGAAVDAAVADAKEAGVEAQYRFLDGHPADELLRFAQEEDADVIVIGSRGLGAVRSLLLGSVSNAVVNKADRPVLIVKAGPEAT